MNSMPSKGREGKNPKRRTPLEDDGDEYGADTVRELEGGWEAGRGWEGQTC